METFFVAGAQLIFITIVYCVAYRTGYKAAHDKAVTIVQECSGPMHELLDRLTYSAEQAIDEDEEEN